MQRAKKGQQKVKILKKTTVLWPSSSYYYYHYFYDMVFSVAAVHEEAVLQPGYIPRQEATPGGSAECCLKLGGGSLEALKRQWSRRVRIRHLLHYCPGQRGKPPHKAKK